MSQDEGGPVTPVGPDGRPLIEYPTDYPLKVIGLSADDLVAHVRGLIAAAGLRVGDEEVTTRASGGGKYLSVSLSVRLDSEAERHAVYAALKADPRVIYYL
jgi:putative lipoic acid-binding regulatory protein